MRAEGNGSTLFVTDAENISLHGSIPGLNVTIQCGGEPIVIDKLYGPLSVSPIRIHLDFERCEWVIEKEETSWVEVARFEASSQTKEGEDHG